MSKAKTLLCAVLALLLLTISLFMALYTGGNQAMAKDYYDLSEERYQNILYVSPSGNDANDGSIGNPLKTIDAAKQKVRSLNQNMEKDIAVVLREGVYSLGKTVVFDNADSGTNGHDVVWLSYPGEVVKINGGKQVTGWQSAGNGIYKAPLEINEVRQMYIDGNRAVLCRSEGYNEWMEILEWQDPQQRIKVYSEDLGDFKTGEMVVHMNWSNNILRVKAVEEVQGDPTVKLIQPEDFEASVIFNRSSPFKFSYQPYYLQNAKCLLDKPGEFYYDAEEKQLYYIPKEGEDLNSAEVIVPYIDTLFKVSGTSGNDPAKNIVFTGLVFEYSAFDGVARYGFTENQSNHYAVSRQGSVVGYEVPTAAVHLEKAQNIIVDRCVIRKSAGSGINLYHSLKNCEVRGNLVTEIGATGIFIAPVLTEVFKYDNPQMPKDKSIRVQNSVIHNNVVSWTGLDFAGANGIINCIGDHIVIRNNEVAFTSYTGIGLGWGWSTRENDVKYNIIANNEIHHTSMTLCDTGGIYTLNAQRGTQIRGNYIHDIMRSKHVTTTMPAYGIYLDEGSNYMVVTDNVINNTNEDEYLIFTHQTGANNYIAGNYGENKQIQENAGLNEYYKKITLNLYSTLGNSMASQIGLGHMVNNLSGEAGMSINLKKDIKVNALGRFYCVGNSAMHTIKIIDAASMKVIAKTVVDMGVGIPDANGFKYSKLEKPITLKAGKTYFVVSEEKFGGDYYVDKETKLIYDKNVFTVESYILHEDGKDTYYPAKKLPDTSMAGVNILYK